ncbi:MAG: hypothetical protein BRC25_00090 [Parcubacteria group bacterium SW_6_46_9]|nr:MAG: hypothetical protein BRC25_00090 [Parcubacteria group bacterium SW_6_46_9]
MPSQSENTLQGNAIPWEDWEQASEFIGHDPCHAHIGGEAFSEKIAKDVKTPVLDIGCGWGGLIAKLPEGKVVGVDISEYSIKKAKEHVNRSDVTLIESDILNLDSSKIGTFATVLSIDVLPLVEKKEEVLQKARSSLQDSGRFIFTDYFAPSSFGSILTPYGGAVPEPEETYREIISQHFDRYNIRDRTDACIAETEEIIEELKANDELEEWIVEKWGQDYYDHTVDLSHRWISALQSGDIKYVLVEASLLNQY